MEAAPLRKQQVEGTRWMEATGAHEESHGSLSRTICNEPRIISETMLRIAIIGCGKVADQHMDAIRRLADCKVVAVCDQELLMAQQLGERFGISACFSNLSQMLEGTAPDVVHITTPPQSHFALAKQCLEA